MMHCLLSVFFSIMMYQVVTLMEQMVTNVMQLLLESYVHFVTEAGNSKFFKI